MFWSSTRKIIPVHAQKESEGFRISPCILLNSSSNSAQMCLREPSHLDFFKVVQSPLPSPSSPSMFFKVMRDTEPGLHRFLCNRQASLHHVGWGKLIGTSEKICYSLGTVWTNSLVTR